MIEAAFRALARAALWQAWLPRRIRFKLVHLIWCAYLHTRGEPE